MNNGHTDYLQSTYGPPTDHLLLHYCLRMSLHINLNHMLVHGQNLLFPLPQEKKKNDRILKFVSLNKVSVCGAHPYCGNSPTLALSRKIDQTNNYAIIFIFLIILYFEYMYPLVVFLSLLLSYNLA